MKFETLKAKHQNELMILMNEVKKEKTFREQECKKYFKQWHENLSLRCTLISSIKIPLCVFQDEFNVKRSNEELDLKDD